MLFDTEGKEKEEKASLVRAGVCAFMHWKKNWV